MIRIGRRTYDEEGKVCYPKFDGFSPIIVMTPKTAFGSLSPYSLRDEQGRLLENVWQFSKVYEKVTLSVQYISRWNHTITWEWPAETHLRNNQLTQEYFHWRREGMNARYAIRYPNGHRNRSQCLFSLKEGEETRLDYVEARKQIYLPEYCRLVRQKPQFETLTRRLRSENLLIIEIDGPRQESLDYYVQKYGVADSFIEDDTMLATAENLKIMLNDTTHPFGHGYCLAAALLDLEKMIV